jgi:hypothetical protein
MSGELYVTKKKLKDGLGQKGQPIITGDRSERFKEFVHKHFGMTKEQFLAEIETKNAPMSENLLRKVKALELWNNHIVGAMSQYYKSISSSGLSLQADIIVLESDLVERRMRMMEKDPNYDPLEDEVYQNGLIRKAELLKALQKFQIDTERLKNEQEKSVVKRVGNADTVTVDNITFDDN